MEKITKFVVWYISLKQSCLNYIKNTCNTVYLFKNIYVIMCETLIMLLNAYT